jgi:hypothetical protein
MLLEVESRWVGIPIFLFGLESHCIVVLIKEEIVHFAWDIDLHSEVTSRDRVDVVLQLIQSACSLKVVNQQDEEESDKHDRGGSQSNIVISISLRIFGLLTSVLDEELSSIVIATIIILWKVNWTQHNWIS